MPNKVETVLFEDFGGLRTSIANPPGNTAIGSKNMVRNKITGLLQLADGYAQKFDDGGDMNLPQRSDAGEPNYLVPVAHKFTALDFVKFTNVFIAEHGGQDVTLAIATYSKEGFVTGLPVVSRFGIWARPYWDGSSWIDEWQELTEQFNFELYSTDIASATDFRFYIDDGIVWDMDDPAKNSVFNNSHFVNWVMKFEGVDRRTTINECGFVGASFYLRAQYVAPPAIGTLITVQRNYLPFNLPDTITAQLYAIQSEARLTTGNTFDDVGLMIGFRNKEWAFDEVGFVYPEDTLDRLIVAPSMFRLEDTITNMIDLISVVNGAGADALDVGTYYFDLTLTRDDGSESHSIQQKNITTIAGDIIAVSLVVVLATLPKWAKGARLYMGIEEDATSLIHEWNFSTAGWTAFDQGTAYFQNLNINKTLFDARTPLLSVNINRNPEDDGVIRYKYGTIVKNRTYAVGVMDIDSDGNEILYPGKVFSSTFHGDGSKQLDVYPNDSLHVIDLDYGRSDDNLAVTPVNNDVLVLRERSIIQLSFNDVEGFVPRIISQGYGIASVDTLVNFDKNNYWLDYKGVMRYNAQRGLEIINYAWLQDLLLLSRSTVEAAKATIDSKRNQYRLLLNGREYVYDIDSGEWLIQEMLLSPEEYALDSNDVADFLNAFTLFSFDGSSLQNEQNFEFNYETNEIYPKSKDKDYEMNVLRYYVQYESDVDITLRIYKNASADELTGSPFTLPKEKTRVVILAGVNSRCSSFRMKFSGETTGVNQSAKIINAGAKYELIEVGGDILTESA